MEIDNLTIGEAKQLAAFFSNQKADDSSHWLVGKNYMIRTVTMILVGKLEKVTAQELVLSSAAWVPETDRYNQFLKEGKIKECEPYPDGEVIVGRGAIIDAAVWHNPLLREAK